ncbi:MAG: CoA transferase [Dehalococcoidia bacterium]|nr:CoA transferase [Dehalococcoidia bacterium]MDP6783061.1 CoA transferase [Dehalococcoidia bacterium]
MLSSLRVLDLTDHRGWACGRILADMGAEVVKVEPLGGDPSRSLGPFFGDVPHPERSLYWFSYNAGKKGITLNLDSPEGAGLLHELSARADILVESFHPGYMDGLGLGYEALSQDNPGLIYTSITPFGLTGPRRDYKATDLTLQALAGIACSIGEPEREPLKMCLDQSFVLGGSHAVIGSLLALHYRSGSGAGQHVDISIFDCLMRLNYRDPVRWDIDKSYAQRQGNVLVRGRVNTRNIWRCKDGYVTWILAGGPTGARENGPLTEWMVSEGAPGAEEMAKVNWMEMDLAHIPQEQVDHWQGIFASFFASRTKEELWQGGLNRRLTLVPVMDIEEAFHYEQPRARGFWHKVEHPHLNATLEYPGHLFLSNTARAEVRGPAPLIGEHNNEVYGSWLGLSRQQIDDLRAQGAV